MVRPPTNPRLVVNVAIHLPVPKKKNTAFLKAITSTTRVKEFISMAAWRRMNAGISSQKCCGRLPWLLPQRLWRSTSFAPWINNRSLLFLVFVIVIVLAAFILETFDRTLYSMSGWRAPRCSSVSVLSSTTTVMMWIPRASTVDNNSTDGFHSSSFFINISNE